MTPNLGWLEWVAPALILTQVALWASGGSDARSLALVVVIAETLLTIVVLGRTIHVFRSSQEHGETGDDWLDHIDLLFSNLFPKRVAEFASSEVRVFGTLLQWGIAKIRRQAPRGYSYNRHQMLFGWVMLFTLSAPAEMLLLHVLIPWNPVKYIVLALEVYGLVWLAVIGISFGFLRHTVSPAHLRLRKGLLADIRVRRDNILELREEHSRSADGRTDLAIDGDMAIMPVDGRTDMTLDLIEPIRIRRLFGFSPPVRQVRFAVDDTAAFVAAFLIPDTERVGHEYVTLAARH